MLVILICAFALGCAYVSFVLMAASGFIFGDIDYTEAQMRSAENKAGLVSLFGFISLCASLTVMYLSGRIARFILRARGGGGAA